MFGRRRAKSAAPLRSLARVATDSPERYAKQLAAHLGRRVAVTELADGSRRLTFEDGTALLDGTGTHLVMTVDAATPAAMAQVQDVLARHLVRFGQRQELTVEFSVPQPVEG